MTKYVPKMTEKHTRFYILLSCLLVLLMIRYGLQIGIPRAVLTAIIALIAVSGSRNEILAIAMCCIPLHEAVDFFYVLVACAGAYVIKNNKKVRINLGVCLTLLIILWELLHCFDPGFSVLVFLTSIIPLIFLAVILCVDVSDVDYPFVVRVMALVVAATCVILLTNLIVRANFNIIAAVEGLRRLGLASKEDDVMLGGALNPNSLGIICVLAAAGLFQLRTVKNNKKIDIVFVICLITFGALTSSRTFLACLILMVLLLFFSQPGGFWKKVRLLISCAILLCIVLLLLYWLFPDLLEYYVKRFQDTDLTTGRGELMTIYHKYIMDNVDVLFFGIGRHNYTDKLTKVYKIAKDIPHNSVQEIIVAWGIPGLILFSLLLMFLVRQARKYNWHLALLNYIPLLIILAKSMAGQLLISHYTMLALSYAYLSLCQNFQLKEE